MQCTTNIIDTPIYIAEVNWKHRKGRKKKKTREMERIDFVSKLEIKYLCLIAEIISKNQIAYSLYTLYTR